MPTEYEALVKRRRIRRARASRESAFAQQPWLVDMFKRVYLVTSLREDRYLRPYLAQMSAAGINSMADLLVRTPDQLFDEVPASSRIKKRILSLAEQRQIIFRRPAGR